MTIIQAIRERDPEALQRALDAAELSPEDRSWVARRVFAAAEPPSGALVEVVLGGELEPIGLSGALHSCAKKGWTELAALLLDRGAPATGPENQDQPIGTAAEHGHLELVRMLLAAGASTAGSRYYPSPLVLAAQSGHAEIVSALLSAGGSLEGLPQSSAPRADARAALVLAISGGHAAMVEALIAVGTALGFVTKTHHTPLELARKEGQSEIAALLEAAAAPEISPEQLGLEGAATRGFTQRVQALWGEADEDEQREALEIAMAHGHHDLVQTLCEGLEGELRVLGLCLAAQENALESMRWFLDRGVDIDALPGQDYPAILYAARRDRLEAATFLIRQGANVNQGDYRGETALHIAAEKNHLAMCELLVTAGANLGLEDQSGRTPLRTAREYDADDTAAFLKRRAKPRSARAITRDTKAKLSPHKRRAFKPRTATSRTTEPGGSRLGGLPGLKRSEAWPRGASGTLLPFLAQIDLGSLPAEVLGGKRKGLAQLFYSGDTHEHLVRIVPRRFRLVLAEAPADLPPLTPAVRISGWASPKDDWPQAGSVQVLLDADERDVARKLNLAGDKAGGWPHAIQDVPRPVGASGRPLGRLLIQLDTGGKLPYELGDSGIGFLFISDEKPLEIGFVHQSL